MRSVHKDKMKVSPKDDQIRNNAYIIGSKEFFFSHSYVMGILNVTPDSFSDGGLYFKRDDAIKHGIEMLDTGADIIDIGGESTRPGAESISAFEEINRIIPVIEGILSRKPSAIISVDTTKSRVAEEALKRGVQIINDISGGTFSPDLLKIVSDHNAAFIVMHILGEPSTMQQNPVYQDLIEDVYSFLQKQTEAAKKHGIDKIIIDPGIGFGKTFEDNLSLIKKLNRFQSLNFPMMIGVSRKSLIHKIVGDLTDDRDAASAIINALAIKNGATFIRTHNVNLGIQTCRILNNLS